MICYLCRRDRDESKLTDRRCTNREDCIRYALAHCRGLVVGTYAWEPWRPRLARRR